MSTVLVIDDDGTVQHMVKTSLASLDGVNVEATLDPV